MSSLINGLWPDWAPRWEPLASAGGAITLTMYGFQVKTALQLQQPLPKFNPVRALWDGAKTAPTIALVIGTQLWTSDQLKARLFKGRDPDFFSTLFISTVVGAASAYPLAVFNGRTLPKPKGALEVVRGMSLFQFGAITVREASFVLALEADKMIQPLLREMFVGAESDDSEVIRVPWAHVASFTSRLTDEGLGEDAQEVISQQAPEDQELLIPLRRVAAFTSGFLGSAVGHFVDSALTLMQNSVPLTWRVAQYTPGLVAKGVTMGIFSVAFKAFHQELTE